MKAFKNNKKLNSLNKSRVFYILMFAMLLAAFVVGAITNGESLKNILYHYDGKEHYFTDFFGMIKAGAVGETPYEDGIIYPPLAMLFFRALSLLFNCDLDKTVLRDTSLGMVMIISFYVVVSVMFALCVAKFKKGRASDKATFIALTLCSLPMLFLFERGNTVNLAMVLILVFVFLYDNEKAVVRQIGFIALAIAVSLKIYPVIFGLLLLKNFDKKSPKKSIIDILSCIGWGAIFFFVPFVFFGGFGEIKTLINNVFYTSSMFSEKGYGFKVNFTIISGFFGELTNHPYAFDLLGNAVMVFVLLSGIFMAMFAKYSVKWKPVALLSLLIILIPAFSFVYNIIFMIIPLIMFLNEEKKGRLDLVYLILFALEFGVIICTKDSVSNIFSQTEVRMNIATLIEAFSLYLMTALLLLEGFLKTIKNNKTLFKVLTILFLIMSVGVAGVYSYHYTPLNSGFSLTNMSIFKVNNNSDKQVVKAYKERISALSEDKKTLVFPKIGMLDFDGEITYFDTSYYNNSIYKKEQIKKLKPDYVVIYDVQKADIKADERAVSNAEIEKYQALAQMVKKYCLKNNYEKLNTFKVNDIGEITIYQKTKTKNVFLNSGDGSKESPYLVTSAQDLISFSEWVNAGNEMSNKYIKLTKDIDMSNCENFSPIAEERTGVTFDGIFDGNGYKIKNLIVKGEKKYKSDNYQNVSLFGSFSGKILNLTLEDCSFVGNKAATFVRHSESSDSLIINCISKRSFFEANSVGEIANDYKGRIYSCMAIDTEFDQKAENFDIVVKSNPKIKAVYSNNKNSQFNNAYLPSELIDNKALVEVLNNSADSYNDLMKKEYESGENKKDFSLELCKWSYEKSTFKLLNESQVKQKESKNKSSEESKTTTSKAKN